jgi:putative transcriptional regulator
MIKNRLRYRLLDKEVSMKELERMTGKAYSTLWRFANSETAGVSFETLDAVCKALGVGVGDLLEYVPDDEGEEDES